jgi:excisionase family DNA binding protein
METMERKAVSVKDFQRACGIGKNYAYELVNTGKIRTLKVGKKWVIPITEIDRWLSQAGGQGQ